MGKKKLRDSDATVIQLIVKKYFWNINCYKTN